jgi:hypothetical protein
MKKKTKETLSMTNENKHGEQKLLRVDQSEKKDVWKKIKKGETHSKR